MTKKINIDKKEFSELLINKRYTNLELAKHFGCSVTPIKRIKKELDLVGYIGYNNKQTKTKKIDIPKDLLEKLWFDPNILSIQKMIPIINSNNIKCSEDTISRKAKEYGFPNRNTLNKNNTMYTNYDLKEIEKMWKSSKYYMSEITNRYNIDNRTLHNMAKLYNWGPFVIVSETPIPKDGLTQTFILKILEFNFETGTIKWAENRGSLAKVGNKAGCIDNGYLRIKIGDKLHMASHLIWLAKYGIYPPYINKKIRHIDQDRSNIAINNLKILEISEEDTYYNRLVRQTPKNVNMKLMKEIRKNCPEGWQVDHIQPISLGGLNEPDNLQYLTKHDNLSKNNRLYYKYKTQPIKWQDII